MKLAKAGSLSMFAGYPGIEPRVMTGTPWLGWSNLIHRGQVGTMCFQSVMAKHSVCSAKIKSWEQKT